LGKVILIIAAVIEFVFRGLPAFFACAPVARLLGLEYIPGALVYIHPFGALMLVFGVMFFVASKDLAKYKLIFDVGILRYALGLGAYVVTLVRPGSMATFWWIHLVIDVVLLILFVVSRPKAAVVSA
jgi:hypothetical protein